jgi:hypothetical protein
MELAPQNAKRVFNQINDYINSRDSEYSKWYCVTTSDWPNQLLKEYMLLGVDHYYVIRRCHSNKYARLVVQEFINIGCVGDVGERNNAAVYVFAYLKDTM